MTTIFTEIHFRTLGKIISWRILLTVMNFMYTYYVTGSVKAGLTVAGISALVNTVIYWAHERIWNRIQWGRQNS